MDRGSLAGINLHYLIFYPIPIYLDFYIRRWLNWQQHVCAPVQPEVHQEELPPPDDGAGRVRHDLPLLCPHPLHYPPSDAEVRLLLYIIDPLVFIMLTE